MRTHTLTQENTSLLRIKLILLRHREILNMTDNETNTRLEFVKEPPAPLVHVFERGGRVWVSYSYVSSTRVVVAYEVMAAAAVSEEGTLQSPSRHSWILCDPNNSSGVSQWSCSTALSASGVSTAYGQARVRFADGTWSKWSAIHAAHLLDPQASSPPPALVPAPPPSISLPQTQISQGATERDAPISLSTQIDTTKILPPAPAQTARCRFMQPDGSWIDYIPNPKSVLIIAAGFNGNAERLHELGYLTTILYDEDYDRYPSNWAAEGFLHRPLNQPAASLSRDLASFADNVVLPTIRELAARGNGPSLVFAGSRGGQVTINRLWRMWHGPSIVLNGGCGIKTAPPQGIPLGLLTQGQDFFSSKDISYTQRLFSSWPGEVIVYHHEADDHSVRSYNYAIGLIMSMVLNVPQTLDGAAERLRTCLWGRALEGRLLMKQKGAGRDFNLLCWG